MSEKEDELKRAFQEKVSRSIFEYGKIHIKLTMMDIWEQLDQTKWKKWTNTSIRNIKLGSVSDCNIF